ncbi:VOC family protein [Alkalicoccobacillus porphyridii]|uniref:VOC family protein n=1 Tax=Alkalicoccobacillus porphyridii TaxID=2597270 RepID=A0A554A1Z9_9BACI|nr:VOC family protein [Alkalicoccobacillus porphyridii]TSB47709.1 VOC family protein [Alkalicoccobacillus porphyridii]
MIQKLGQVMLYVKDQETSVAFWTEKLGFQVLMDHEENGMRWIEIAPPFEDGTSIVLHDQELIAKMSPELNLGTPSLMFFSSNVEQLHEELTDKGVTVGEIVNMGGGKVFNFADEEKNYFAIMEKQGDKNRRVEYL